MPRDPMPDWPDGTPLEVVYAWQWFHCCVLCFKDVCEACAGGPTGDGRPCACPNPVHGEAGDG